MFTTHDISNVEPTSAPPIEGWIYLTWDAYLWPKLGFCCILLPLYLFDVNLASVQAWFAQIIFTKLMKFTLGEVVVVSNALECNVHQCLFYWYQLHTWGRRIDLVRHSYNFSKSEPHELIRGKSLYDAGELWIKYKSSRIQQKPNFSQK